MHWTLEKKGSCLDSYDRNGQSLLKDVARADDTDLCRIKWSSLSNL